VKATTAERTAAKVDTGTSHFSVASRFGCTSQLKSLQLRHLSVFNWAPLNVASGCTTLNVASTSGCTSQRNQTPHPGRIRQQKTEPITKLYDASQWLTVARLKSQHG
jgi:hypothetical protein